MDQSAPIVGCWRAHLNVLQDMVRRGISSTLIFEDDADWDISFKSQLVQFAGGRDIFSTLQRVPRLFLPTEMIGIFSGSVTAEHG